MLGKASGKLYERAMQLTIFTDYGLRALMYLAARPEKRCSVREISDHYGISYNHLVKVVHKLSQTGLIASAKGKGGGLKLAVQPETLRLGDLVRMLEPNMHLVECFDKDRNRCRITSACTLKHYLFDAGAAFIENLNRHTLADTIADKTLFF